MYAIIHAYVYSYDFFWFAAKPWQVAPSNSSATPLGTSNVNDGQPKPWQTGTTTTAGDSVLPPPTERPWRDGMHTADAAAPSTTLAPYNTANGMLASDSPYGPQSDNPYSQPMYGRPMYGSTPYNSSYPSAMTNSPYGGYGTGGMYGSTYGGGMYNNTSMHGTGMYGNAYRGGMGGYGGGGLGMGGYSGAGYGNAGYGGYGGGGYGYSGVGGVQPGMQPPGQPPGGPGQPGNLLEGAKSKWQVFMHSLHNLMNFFGRISFLMDENAHAVHFFITALLQLLDRASFLWGEVARFVLRILGYKFPFGRARSQGNLAKPADASGTAVAPAAASSVAALESAWTGK